MSPDILDVCQSPFGLPAKTAHHPQCAVSCNENQIRSITVQVLFSYMVVYTVYAALENRKIAVDGVLLMSTSPSPVESTAAPKYFKAPVSRLMRSAVALLHSGFGLIEGVVGRAHQRAGFDVLEAHGFTEHFVFGEF